MTDKLNEQCRGLSRFLCGAGERRIIVLYAVAGSGLTTALDELRAGAPSMACVLDDAQRRPGKVQAALARLRGESAARLLAGVDEDDDHPSRVAVADGLGDLVGVGAQARLEPVADELLDAMWRDVVPRTDPAVAAALVQRAGGRPARLRHLLSLPQLERRIRDGRLLMHPDEIAALPVEGAGALRNRWVRLTASERQLVVAVWIAGGRVAAAHLRDHLRQSGLVAVAAAAARAPWLTEDDDELWLG
jgi:hypothetical protein